VRAEGNIIRGIKGETYCTIITATLTFFERPQYSLAIAKIFKFPHQWVCRLCHGLWRYLMLEVDTNVSGGISCLHHGGLNGRMRSDCVAGFKDIASHSLLVQLMTWILEFYYNTLCENVYRRQIVSQINGITSGISSSCVSNNFFFNRGPEMHGLRIFKICLWHSALHIALEEVFHMSTSCLHTGLTTKAVLESLNSENIHFRTYVDTNCVLAYYLITTE
jgi:hypothetical protein